MTIRKRDDNRGFDRGLGSYSDNEKPLKLDRRDHFLRPVVAVPEGTASATFDNVKSAEGTIMGNGDRKAGFAADLDKK